MLLQVKILFVTFFLQFYSGYYSLGAVLDGRVTPIYVESRYTFTNYEWARGNVYFRNGFDLPPGGTINLDINQEVGSDIYLKNGTLRLLGDLKLSSNTQIRETGFINAREKVISFKNDWILAPGQKIGIVGSVVFEGVGSNALSFKQDPLTSGLWVRNSVPNMTFRNFNIVKASTSNFEYSNIVLDNNLTLSCDTVLFDGSATIFQSNKKLKVAHRLLLLFSTIVHVQPQVTLEVGYIEASQESSQLILENARLSYTPTGTFRRFFTRWVPGLSHQGVLVIRGKSELITPPGVEILFTRPSFLLIEPGSSLKINEGTRFRLG